MTTITSSSDNSLSLRQALEYCLDTLKMKQRFGFMIRTTTSVPITMTRTLGNWIIAMKLIAEWNGALSDRDYVFSQTQLYDFLTLASKVIEGRKANDNKIVLEILIDVMENYESFSHSLKSNYPRIIVDVISILHIGIDTNGTRVNPITVGKYYQSRKQQAIMIEEKRPEKISIATTTATTTITRVAPIHRKKIPLSKDELIERLVHITNRDRKELQKSIERLPYSDLKKISELSHNYSRLQHYSKLITKEEFKNEIQKELGRELRPYQLTRAANSIRRVQLYIENILDNKFILDASHGVNHVKHNLEYGYQLMNLIECKKRTRRQTTQ
jgi:hypothetical protein